MKVDIDNMRAGTLTVVIRFTVDVDGKITDIVAENDPGYGLAKQSIDIIKSSPAWHAATMFGKKVKAYRRQPFTFVNQSN